CRPTRRRCVRHRWRSWPAARGRACRRSARRSRWPPPPSRLRPPSRRRRRCALTRPLTAPNRTSPLASVHAQSPFTSSAKTTLLAPATVSPDSVPVHFTSADAVRVCSRAPAGAGDPDGDLWLADPALLRYLDAHLAALVDETTVVCVAVSACSGCSAATTTSVSVVSRQVSVTMPARLWTAISGGSGVW